MRKTTLDTLAMDAVAAAFTLVYTDYAVPVQVGADWMRGHVGANDIRLEHSPLWLDDDGAVVALALLGVRGERGWIGGFGVAPAWRGRGLSHELARESLAVARDLGLGLVQLEVIAGNDRATRTYERAGFQRTRDLHIFSATPDVAGTLPTGGGVTDGDPVELLGARASITPVRTSWQREAAGLVGGPELRAVALGELPAVDGYVVYREGSRLLSLADVAVRDGEGAARLLGALAARHPGLGMSLVNEPEESPLCAVLERLGWSEPLRQHEMVATLDGDGGG